MSATTLNKDMIASNIHLNIIQKHNIDIDIQFIHKLLEIQLSKNTNPPMIETPVIKTMFDMEIQQFIEIYSVNPVKSENSQHQSKLAEYSQKLEQENRELKEDIEELRGSYINLKRHFDNK